MMSKNNSQEILRQASDSCCCYALRKLSVGVASVLIGTTMYVGLVHADTVATSNEPAPIAQAMAPMTAQSVSDNVVTSSDMVQSGNQNKQNAEQVTSSVVAQGNKFSASNQEQQQVQASLSNTNNNVQNSTLNVSADSVNQHFVGLQENLAQNNQENVAKNVQADWLWYGSVVPNDHVIDNVIGDDTHRMGVNFSFDLDSSQFKVGMPISIAKIVQTSNNHGLSTFDYESVTSDVYLHGQKIGYIRVDPVGTYAARDADGYTFSELDYRLFVTNSDLHFTGTQHLNFHVGWLGTLNYHGAWSFRGVKDSMITYHLLGDGLDKTYQVHYQWPSVKVTKDANYVFSDSPAAGTMLTDAGWTNPGIWVDNPILEDADSMQLSLFHNSYGKQGSFSLNRNYRAGLRIRADQGNSILYPNSSSVIGVESEFPLMDSDGNMILTDLHAWNFVDFWQDDLNVSYPQKVYRDGLSLKQLEDLNFQGLSVSKQTDGSLLEYFNLPMSMLKADLDLSKISDGTIWNVANISPYINYVAKSDQDAYNIAKNMIQAWSNSPMQGTPIQLYMDGNEVLVSDPSAHPNVYADLLDLNTGNVLSTSMGAGAYSNVSAKGQSTVKLHVITPSGVVLQQVKSFTDWPDQNKHASLTIPSITGYHLVTNPQSVLSTLHLSGTAISAAMQASYPAENTVSDYYVVMAPDTESVRVNITDSDENSTLSSYTLSGDYGSVITPISDLSTRLESLLSSGKYDLVTNSLIDSPKYSTTNSPITISLKHHLDSTQRHYRVIEDLPGGTKKVIIDMEATLYKDAAVNYYAENGAYLYGDIHQKLLKPDSFKLVVRDGDLDTIDNQATTYIDQVPGYTFSFNDATNKYLDGVMTNSFVDRGISKVYFDLFNGNPAFKYNDLVSGAAVISPLSSRDFHITYTRRSYPVTVNYYDLSGALISSSKSQHLFADSVDVAPSIPTNYVLAPGQSTHFTVSYDTNELDLVVIPRVTISTDSRTITRTIQITHPDRSLSTVVQHVIFSRPAYKDTVSGAITYGLWTTTSQSFIAYQPETIDGYHIDTVKSQVVLPTDKDSIVQVAYTKLATSPTYLYIDAAGHSYNVLPAGYHVVAGQNTKLQSTSALIAKDIVIKSSDDVQYVTRTVTITLPNNRTRTIRQRVRKGTRFGRVAVPKLRGYKVVVTGDSQELGMTAAERDVAMSVRFVKL